MKIVNSREILFKITFNIHFHGKKLDASHLDKNERNDSKIYAIYIAALKMFAMCSKLLIKSHVGI